MNNTVPSIQQAVDSAGKEIPNGGDTNECTVYFSGSAAPGAQMDLTVSGTPEAGGSKADDLGIWHVQFQTYNNDYGLKTFKAVSRTEVSSPWVINFKPKL
ncbi:hypothetical protein [Pseudomonas sp. stari2]|uniref:hypothetical protein n=1 Tax=Pseudomonas sp. Stari2 TaxID=2954814 RepID=UPI00345D7BD3